MAVGVESAAQRPGDPGPACYLARFEPAWAGTVAGWVRSDEELFWLAPATAPPLTAEKVLAWLRTDRDAYLLRWGQAAEPIGYAELGQMPDTADQMWLGHFVIAPAQRGRGLGGQFMQLLLDAARRRHRARRICLIVFPHNVAAIRCYQRAGLQSSGYERRYFHTTGRHHRLLRMSIELPPVDEGERAR